jgi:hypothetical protein
MTTSKNINIMGPEAIIQLHKNDLGTGKILNAEVIAMANVMRKLEETTANLPSKKVNEVVDQLKSFMETLTLSDCEVFARDVRRMIDNLIEVRTAKKDNFENNSPTLPSWDNIIKNLPKNHPWWDSYEAATFKEIEFFKNLSHKLNKIANQEVNIEESVRITKSLENNTLELRLLTLENQLDTLVKTIDNLTKNKGE